MLKGLVCTVSSHSQPPLYRYLTQQFPKVEGFQMTLASLSCRDSGKTKDRLVVWDNEVAAKSQPSIMAVEQNADKPVPRTGTVIRANMLAPPRAMDELPIPKSLVGREAHKPVPSIVILDPGDKLTPEAISQLYHTFNAMMFSHQRSTGTASGPGPIAAPWVYFTDRRYRLPGTTIDQDDAVLSHFQAEGWDIQVPIVNH